MVTKLMWYWKPTKMSPREFAKHTPHSDSSKHISLTSWLLLFQILTQWSSLDVANKPRVEQHDSCKKKKTKRKISGSDQWINLPRLIVISTQNSYSLFPPSLGELFSPIFRLHFLPSSWNAFAIIICGRLKSSLVHTRLSDANIYY